jgi:hypothetical protein
VSASALTDMRHLIVVASVGLLSGSTANRGAVPVRPPVLVNVPYRNADAYGTPSQPYYYPEPVAGNASGFYSLSYYISTMYPQEVLDAIHLLSQLEEWIGPSLIGNLFPSPLIHAWSTTGTAIALDADQYNRMRNIHNVVEHVRAAAGYDMSRTVEALTRGSALGGEAAIEHLKADRYEEAYLAAIRSLRPPRDKGLVTGRGTRRALDATVAFLDED